MKETQALEATEGIFGLCRVKAIHGVLGSPTLTGFSDFYTVIS